MTTTTATTTATTATRVLRRLDDQLDGRLLLPGEAGYDEARVVWNAMVDRRPRAIVRCASVGDVVAAVRAARELDLPIGVRCGGHGILGLAVPEDGIMIDLRPMDTVHVDPARRRAWVSGGALLGALDRATQPYGLATTAGNVSHTGVGGLTLGGGMGWLARRYGLACDNVASFEVVTAAGEVLNASPEQNPDLYWGLRGGGGNFGVVTRFEFRLHPVGTRALSAEWSYPAERAASVLRGWRDLNATAPRQATFDASLGSDQRVTIGFVWVGDPEQGRRLLPSLRSLGRATTERVRELSYLRLQSRDDSPQGHAFRRYWKGHYLDGLSDAAIDALIASLAGDPSDPMRPNASLQAYGGAIAEVPDDDTAFGHRATRFEYVAATRWSDPAEDHDRMATTRRHAAVLDEFASGAYVNALSDRDDAALRRAYPARKLARLAALKRAYDPDNVFHLNQNIRPSSD
jgi:FAD/FMN-containing dehydrogenase